MVALLTDKHLTSLQPGQWATESNARGAGQLQARGLKNKRVSFYFRYTDANHKQTRIPLGTGLTLVQARRKASDLSRQYQEGGMVLPLQRKTNGTSHPDLAQRLTFGTLLLAYVEDLKRRNRSSAREVHNAFERHIHQPHSPYWKSPVTAITTDHILTIIRHVAAQGKLRAADKLRCHIRAAYAAAIQARQDIEGLPALIHLKINTNPARDIPPIRQSSQTKDKVLTLSELQAYWQHIKAQDTPAGALLRFHLLTGGQRIQQLARATYSDYDTDSQLLTLKDPKGRRLDARIHVIPLIPEAQQAMKDMQGGTNEPYLWSVTAGQHGACYSTASKALKQVIEQINRREAQKSEGGSFLTDFTLGDIRRTIETRLAAAGVSRETRAQLQSHGLSGVQVRYYDRHDYLQEKKEALQTLYQLLTALPDPLVLPAVEPLA